MLEAINISHSFDYSIIENTDFSINRGESVSIMGVSGSGKSTILHIFATLLKPKEGEVRIEKKDIYSLSKNEILKIRREDIGFIFQQHYLFRGFNAYENLEISSILSDQKIDEKLLEKFGIENILTQNIGTLSGGQQQRISIARVLTKRPKIIFADEPTGNLDRESARNIIDSLIEHTKTEGCALIIATHDLQLALRCDRSFILEDKKLKRNGAIRESN